MANVLKSKNRVIRKKGGFNMMSDSPGDRSAPAPSNFPPSGILSAPPVNQSNAEEHRMIAEGDPILCAGGGPHIIDNYKTPVDDDHEISPIVANKSSDSGKEPVTDNQGSTFILSADSKAVNVSISVDGQKMSDVSMSNGSNASSLNIQFSREDNFPVRMLGGGDPMFINELEQFEKHGFVHNSELDPTVVKKKGLKYPLKVIVARGSEMGNDPINVPRPIDKGNRENVFSKRLLTRDSILNCSTAVANLQNFCNAAWTAEVENTNVRVHTPMESQLKFFLKAAEDFSIVAQMSHPGLKKKSDVAKGALHILSFVMDVVLANTYAPYHPIEGSPFLEQNIVEQTPKSYLWQGLQARLDENESLTLVDQKGNVHRDPNLGQGVTINYSQEPPSPTFANDKIRISGRCGGGKYTSFCDAARFNSLLQADDGGDNGGDNENA